MLVQLLLYRSAPIAAVEASAVRNACLGCPGHTAQPGGTGQHVSEIPFLRTASAPLIHRDI